MGVFRGFGIVSAACALVACAVAQPFWSQYGRNAQHTAEVTTGVQQMNQILWQTPVDLYPSTSGAIHYGSPLITIHGTVVVNVRNGPSTGFGNDTFQIEGHALGTGQTNWIEQSDYTDWMPHDWIPSFGSAMDNNGVLYSPGAGGTILRRQSVEEANSPVTRFCFYGMSNYEANQAAFNSNVQVCTPITVDEFNNIYFGFYVTQGWSNALGLASGIAKISPTGVGTWVTADNASGDAGDEVATNCTPAISNDGQYLYIAVKQAGTSSYANPKLLRLRTSNLTTASEVALQPPPDTQGNATFAYVLDVSTASPMVGPDGDVFYGIWWSDLGSRGFMLHYSADLSQTKPAGAFGWDDTPSVVPSYAVPSYSGNSKYLILCKYNNYSDPGIDGDGLNRVAVLDPDNTEYYTVQYGPTHNPPDSTGPTYVCMNEVISIVGPTANQGIPGVDEWCINMAAIDIKGKAAVINSEDGHAYRWDFTTNKLTNTVDLAPPTSEAYTSTMVSQDGVAFAINDGLLNALWDGAAPASVTTTSPTITAGNNSTGTVTLSTAATGPGAVIYLSSNNPHVTLPRAINVLPNRNSASFDIDTTPLSTTQNVTITANRYGFTASTQITLIGQALYSVFLSKNPIAASTTAKGSVTLTGPAPMSGRTITLSSNLAAIKFNPSKLVIPSGYDSASFNYSAGSGSVTQTGHVTATLDDGSSLTIPISIQASKP